MDLFTDAERETWDQIKMLRKDAKYDHVFRGSKKSEVDAGE